MDPSFSASASVGVSPEGVIGWYEKIKKNFSDFKPETRTMRVNFGRGTSQIGLHVVIGEGFRKKHNKIKVPAYDGFRITRLLDESFKEHNFLWGKIGDTWELDASQLPDTDNYFIEMEGVMDAKTANSLVYIKPTVNRDNDKENDKYWLDASLRNPTLLEKAWSELQIDEVNVGVDVDVNKLFGLRIPQEIKDKAEALTNLQKAAVNFDRNTLFQSALSYKKEERKSPFHPVDFLQAIHNLTARETMKDYLSIEIPFRIGTIDQPTKFKGLVPNDVKVQALTTLTLKLPQAEGFLIFNRAKYLKQIEKEFDKILPMKNKKKDS